MFGIIGQSHKGNKKTFPERKVSNKNKQFINESLSNVLRKH